jgi:hypothetical protein
MSENEAKLPKKARGISLVIEILFQPLSGSERLLSAER